MQQQEGLLPYKEEFLLELMNNNYSEKTIKSYRRDLDFFESFLWSKRLKFQKVDKLKISAYKGFLNNGDHTGALHEYLDHLAEKKEAEQKKEMGLVDDADENETDENDENAEKTREDGEKSGKSNVGQGGDTERVRGTGEIKESGSKGPKKAYKKKEGLSPRSINRMLTSLRNYLKFLIEIDVSVPIAPDAIKLIKTERKESQVAELGDLINLIESPEEFETNARVKARNRAILEVIFSTGMRISEVINLDREHLNIYVDGSDPDGIAGKMYIKGKGNKSRFVYLTERCKHWLDRYLQTRQDDYPALFIPYRGGRAGTKDPATVRISPNYVQSKIAEYRRKLGIVVPTSAHSLRHGFATYLAEEGASPAAIQKLLGHESLQTTTRYVHASDRFAESAHREYHPLQEDSVEVGK